MLKDELLNDPEGIGYVNMTDEQAKDSLNAKTINALKDCHITALGVMDELGADEGAAVLEALEAASLTNPAVKWAMKSISTTGVNVGNPTVRGMLDQFATGGVLSQASVDVLKAKAEMIVSRAEQLGIYPVRTGHVTEARK